jgi:hypothetical protein
MFKPDEPLAAPLYPEKVMAQHYPSENVRDVPLPVLRSFRFVAIG